MQQLANGPFMIPGYRLRLTFLALAVCAMPLVFGCNIEPSQSDSGTVSSSNTSDLGESWLSEELRSVPYDYGNSLLWFADLRGAKEAHGAAHFKGMETIMSEGTAPPEGVFKILTWDMPGRDYAGQIYKNTGIDLWGFDSVLWAGEPSMRADSPHITILRGGFGNDIGNRLEQLEYESDSYRGTTWYYAWSGPSVDIRKLRSSPFAGDAAQFNAIAPVDDRLLIRRWAGNMQSQINIHKGAQASLWDEEAYREIAQAMGSRLLAGAFVSPSNVQDAWSTFDYNLSPHAFPGFAPGSASWEDLDEYSVALIGYGAREGREYSTLALHYGDSKGAERNAAEFARRLRTAQIYLYNDGSNVPQGNDETIHHPPLASVCASLDVEAIEYSEFSVLVADCEAPDEANDLATIGGLTASGMWSHVLYFGNLHFLVPGVGNEHPWWQIF